jgi:hypothetical protein
MPLPDQEIRSAAFDSHRRLLHVLRNERLAMLPFGPQELSDALEEGVKFCLTAEKRQRLLSAYEPLATRRTKRACKIAVSAKD